MRQLMSLPSELYILREADNTPPSVTVAPPKVKQETIVEKAIREAKDDAQLQALLAAAATSAAVDGGKVDAAAGAAVPAVPEKKKSLMEKIKDEAKHYWHGTKLLGTEINISRRLLVKLLRGNKLSRREQRQLKRTTTDILRLVPFIVILIIPFMELALPLLLRFFPNMLPSTFESKFQEEEKKKKLLKMRLEMAKFLQETVEDITVSGASNAAVSKEFTDFFNKCRSSGQPVASEDIIRIAKKFPDELTLQNLSRPQLVSMCKYMSITAFGTDSFLRHQLQRRLRYLEADDSIIMTEGVNSLTIPELQQVCQSRGIRTIGVSPARMRSELEQWLELHLKHKIPPTLLILSKAFQMTDKLPASIDAALKENAEALKATLSSLPHQVVNEAQLRLSEAEGSATYKQKLDVLKEQEELIADELEQEAALAAAKKAQEEQEAALKQAKEEEAARRAKEEEAAAKAAAEETVAPIPAAPTPAPVKVEEKPAEPVAKEAAQEEDKLHLSEEELMKLSDALKTLTKVSALEDVKDKLEGLKEERKEFKEDVEELHAMTQKVPNPATSRISSRVDKMITKIEKELAKYDQEIGSSLNLVRPDEEGRITIEDLGEALRVIRDHPDDERIQRIVMKLDADGDGRVAMDEIIHLAEEAEKEGHGEIVQEIKKVAVEGKKLAVEAGETIAEIQKMVEDEKKAGHDKGTGTGTVEESPAGASRGAKAGP
ncbi:hypothetical protein HK104_001860 [Borealophlyctis nickersoniae]|nr:hypothetical protein HK104_001860 [Borealophlyctis nickersoniae]